MDRPLSEIFESEPLPREPWQMSHREFLEEYENLMNAVRIKENNGRLDPMSAAYEPLSSEEQELLARDWKAFSRKRGFSEADIQEYERWLTMSGQRDSLPGVVNDPWRRDRWNWGTTLYIKHIERALTEGRDVPDHARNDYQHLIEK